jgi:protein-tyrosine phosphatase
MRVLVVCSANVCRSPTIAALLRQGWLDGPAAGWQVWSAGTRAAPGVNGPCREAAAWLADRDIDLFGHVPQRLTAQHVADADLVVALGREHRAAVVRLSPGAAARSFTLTEAVTLLGHVAESAATPSPPDEVVRRLHAARGGVRVPERRRSRWRPRAVHVDGTSLDGLDVADAHTDRGVRHQQVLSRLGSLAPALAHHLEQLVATAPPAGRSGSTPAE